MAARQTTERRQFEADKLALFRMMVERAELEEDDVYAIARNFWVMQHLDLLTNTEKKKYQYLFNNEIQ